MLVFLVLLLPRIGDSATHCAPKLEWTTGYGQILMNGRPFVLKGINYFGFETETFAPHGLWTGNLDFYLDVIKNNNFNAIRVPFSLEMVRRNPIISIDCDENPSLCGFSALELLDVFIDRAADRGLLIMLDNHRTTASGGISELWYNDEYTEKGLINLWRKLCDRYKTKWNLFAIDLKNEPHGLATWGNSSAATDWNKAAERIIDALSDFPGLFFVEGVERSNNLDGARLHPINTSSPDINLRVVYSPHAYGPSVYDRPEFSAPNFPHNLWEFYVKQYQFVVKHTGGRPVVLGEWVSRLTSGSRDETWNEFMVDFMTRSCVTNTFYWCLNPNTDTGGLLLDDWTTVDDKKANLTHRAQPNPTKFRWENGQLCYDHGSFPYDYCS